uniref:Uncharacterized protein n=1 Tax=Siphoviridae sp. ctLgc23 TaxID=2825455 RepID=A0A8S5QHB2_9CAUD|nr:MAG TPA: hypothetical protein [Siphoviridae sp. ctLgc23]
MSVKDFILQGLTAQSHSAEIKKMFSDPSIEHAIVSVAFLTSDGISQLKDIFLNIPKSSHILVGISNGITSYQGLTDLLSIFKGFYTVDTGGACVLFHPKIYFLRTADTLKAIIGSANLTRGGLNNNIEASVYIEIHKSDENFSELLNKIEGTINETIADNPDNVKKITSQSELDDLFSAGLLVDEFIQQPARDTIGKTGSTNIYRPKAIKLKTPRILSSVKRKKQSSNSSNASNSSQAVLPVNMEFEPVWRSKELAERDLNIPQGSNTHPTGSINLDKGSAPLDMDHRHYFKEDVFTALSWTTKGKTVVEATATFLLEIKGIYIGEFSLNIRHTTSTDTEAYRQRNAMTRLSWGAAKPHIANKNLLGCFLTLSVSTSDPKIFLISID